MSDVTAIAALHDLDLSWKDRMPAGVIAPQRYLGLVTKYAAEATHQFRRQGSFLAMPLERGIKIWTLNSEGGIEGKYTQEAKEPLIVRFDNNRYADYRDRAQAMFQIAANSMQRHLTQQNLNNPDFLGTDIWTWTQKDWKDYKPFVVHNAKEPGKWVFAEEAWDKTSRMLVQAPDDEPHALSYSWGKFEMDARGDLAGFEREFEPLKQAIAAVDEELASITGNNTDLALQEIETLREALIIKHLFKIHTPEEGEGQPFYVTKFDVYPQKVNYAVENFRSKADYERARSDEANPVKKLVLEFDRFRKYGRAGHRSNVLTIDEIDARVLELNRRQADPSMGLHHAA